MEAVEKKVLQYAKEFESLGQRLKEVISLVKRCNGKVIRVIGLTYGSDGLNYAIQINFTDHADHEKFENLGKQMIKGFLMNSIKEKNPLMLIKVALGD